MRVSLDKTPRGARGKTMASTAALDQSSPSLLRASAPRTAPPGWHTRSSLPLPAHGIAWIKKKSPVSRRGPLIHFNRKYLLAEAVHQAALDAQVILLCAAKVGVQILELDRPERQVGRQGEVRAAAERHRKRIR